MAKASTLNLTMSVTGDGMNMQNVPIAAFQNLASPGIHTQFQLVAGNNLIAPPTGVTYTAVVMVFPQGSSNGKTMKGGPSDSGFGLLTSGWIAFAVPSSISFNMGSNGTEIIDVYWL